MATVHPFRGLLYNTRAVNLADVVAPPYDVISPEMQQQLYENHPRNVVRLILNRDPDPYSSAAQSFAAWQEDGTLVRDAHPAFYLLGQTFAGPQGRDVERVGIVGACRLEEFKERIILPHERTLAKPKEDRLKLFRATESNLSQVFGVYRDPAKTLSGLFARSSSSRPDLDVVFEGVRNRLWRIDSKDLTGQITAFFQDKQILIADGHHRYETALAYRNERRSKDPHAARDASYEYVMMFLTNSSDEGLVVLPTHRVVHSIKQFDATGLFEALGASFDVASYTSPEKMMQEVALGGSGTLGMVLRDRQGYHTIKLKPGASLGDLIEGSEPEAVKRLDVAILHFGIFSALLGVSREAQEQKTNLDYMIDPVEAVSTVQKGYAQAAFLLNPTPVDQVYEVASAGHTMPQKSTYFYPKLLSGMVFHSHRP